MTTIEFIDNTKQYVARPEHCLFCGSDDVTMFFDPMPNVTVAICDAHDISMRELDFRVFLYLQNEANL